MDEDQLIELVSVEVARRVVQKGVSGLKVNTIEYLGGASFSVFAVNGDLVFRFPKTDPAIATRTFEFENKLLEYIRPHVMPHEIPTRLYSLCGVDADFPGPVCGYRWFPGVQVAGLTLGQEWQQRLARLLGDFLSKLHTIDLEALYSLGFEHATADVIERGWFEEYKRVRQAVLPILEPDEQRWITQLYDSFLRDAGARQFSVALVHGDLGPENVLLPANFTHLQVIDFEDASPYDPAADFCIWWGDYGEEFLTEMIRHYIPDLGNHFVRRVRFHYNRIPVIYFDLGIAHRNDNFIRFGRALLHDRMWAAEK